MDKVYHRLFKGTYPKILCIGKNYIEHVKEMGGNAFPASPIVFTKPMTAVLAHTSPIVLPPNTLVHHELEFAVMIGKRGKNISEVDAMKYVGGYALGLDLTKRDLQDEAKKWGYPWLLSKGFDGSLPLSPFIPRDKVRDPHELLIELKINGKTQQRGNTENMHYRIEFLIQYLSSIWTLNKGDIIMTGTPPGVGPIKAGDLLLATCSTHEEREILSCEFRVQ